MLKHFKTILSTLIVTEEKLLLVTEKQKKDHNFLLCLFCSSLNSWLFMNNFKYFSNTLKLIIVINKLEIAHNVSCFTVYSYYFSC